MKFIGVVLSSVGIAILVVYSVYFALSDFFNNAAVPVVLKVVFPLVVVGMALLLAATLREKLAGRSRHRTTADNTSGESEGRSQAAAASGEGQVRPTRARFP